jgi:HTH-type transcriptional regulator / antitoxin HigA
MAIKQPHTDHPGAFIADELERREWLQADLAYILNMDASQLNKLLAGKVDINTETAVALGDAFDMPAEFFLNLQKMYSLSKASAADPGVKTRASWLSVFPVREMIKRGWIEDSEPALLNLQMMRFFEKNRVEDIPFVNGAPVLPPHAAKKSGDYSTITPAQFVWLYRVRKVAEKMPCAPYSRAALLGNLDRIRAHMLDADDFSRIPAILQECGVRVVFVEALPGGKIDGVCLWLDDQPVIGLSLRLARPDNFCFVLRHEIEHILEEDGKDETFAPVDVFDGDLDAAALPDCERSANEKAADFCVPRAKLKSFLLRKGQFISERDVLAFAATIQIHPGVVVGQIQHETKKWGWLRKYQTNIQEHFLDWEFRDGWGHVASTDL